MQTAKAPLSITHPDLAKQACGWDPSTLTAASGKKLPWRCRKGHIWEAVVASRSKGSGCGVCRNYIIIPGVNDLASLYPEIAKDADGWDPATVGAGSHKRRTWRCSKGHIWETNPKHRIRGTNCPVCDGQKIVLGVNDLATTNPDLAIQAFGWDPKITVAKHHQKYFWKCEKGHVWEASITARKGGSGCLICTGKQGDVGYNSLSVIYPEIAKEAYGWNPENEFAGGSSKKLPWRCPEQHVWISTISNRTGRNRGCPICINRQLLTGFNDLATTHPNLASQANGWDPKTKIAGSNKKFSWICPSGHTWDSVLASRAHSDAGCPFCAGVKVWPGFNDLETTHPGIAKDASDWDPTKVSFGSSKQFFWKCELGHLYKARINHRASGASNCHFCSGLRVLKGFNDLETVNPKLASEAYLWDPTSITVGSSTRRKWQCAQGHTWTATVGSRSGGHKTGCPTCAKSGFDPNSEGYLYFLVHQHWEMFQIGITNVPDDRLARHKKLGWKVLELRGPMDGHLTQQWETSILRMLKARGADLSNSKIVGKFDGYSEAWSEATFNVESIKELMQLNEEFEES